MRAADSRPYKENRKLIPNPSRATARAAPTAYPAPGALVRETQAQFLNRTSGNFCKPRAQWPGRKRGGHSIFARRKFSNIKQESVPRNGVRGKATMSTKCSSEPSPAAFWFLCRRGQRNSPPAGGEIPLRKTTETARPGGRALHRKKKHSRRAKTQGFFLFLRSSSTS